MKRPILALIAGSAICAISIFPNAIATAQVSACDPPNGPQMTDASTGLDREVLPDTVGATSGEFPSPNAPNEASGPANPTQQIAPSKLSLDPPPGQLDTELPQTVDACACGCGIFEVGTSSMLPAGQGGTLFLEYDYQDQNSNWHGAARAPAANNPDKDIRTSFLSLGLQYMFNRSWGFQGEIPYDLRHFQTTGGASGTDVVALNWGSVGDIRLEGIYTGFYPDLSAGLTFGVKLPTGSFKHNDAYGDIDRDSELGTGSTDALLGGFYRRGLTADNNWTWFAQANSDLPIFTQDGYRPGFELDAATGVYYGGFYVGKLNVTPVGQILTSLRSGDSGPNAAHPRASGYERLLLSPGIEVHYHPFMIYADVEVPVFQDYTGDQLAAPVLFKLIFSYSF